MVDSTALNSATNKFGSARTGIDRPELFSDAHLSFAAGRFLLRSRLPSFSLFILFYLSQSEYSPETFVINNLPLGRHRPVYQMPGTQGSDVRSGRRGCHRDNPAL